MLQQSVYTIGTSPTQVVAPTVDAGRYVLKNLEPPRSSEQFARQGKVYDVASTFTVLRNTSTTLAVTTGATGMQFQFYTISATAGQIQANLIEGATPVLNGVVIPSYNLNRNFPDDADGVFQGVTSFTGGTVVYKEFLTADKHAGGAMSASKIITLAPNSTYLFRFSEVGGNADPKVFLQIGFAELYNGYNDIWLGAVDDSLVIKAGEEIIMELQPEETIQATAIREGLKLSVMRQD